MDQTGLLLPAMILLSGTAIRNPHLRHRPIHDLLGDAGDPRIIRLMHHRIFAVKYPMIRVPPFDPHTGFVAGSNPRGGPPRRARGGAARRMDFAPAASILNPSRERINMFINAPRAA